MRKALVVGINDYSPAPLTGCINDAQAMASLLEKNGDNSPNFSVQTLTDVKKNAELKAAIVKLFSGSGDVALFYFSGHGCINDIGGYLVTPDACSYDEGVSMADLMTIVNNSHIRNKIIILDCCYSGAVGNMQGLAPNISGLGVGTTILTASTSCECSIEIAGHGVFTNLLIQALQGGAADFAGNITPGGIYSFVDQALGAWYPRPVFKTNVQQFIPLRKIKPQVPVDIIRLLTTYFQEPTVSFSLNPSFEYTNSPDEQHKIIAPYANPRNVEIFKNLQKLQSIGLVVPEETEHMYFAAMESKSCRLTPLGIYYWNLVHENRI